jgi:hypothetical protein
MKYLTLIFFGIIVWVLVDEFVLSDRSEEGLETVGDKFKDLRKRLHWVFGLLAALIIAYFLVRLAYRIMWPNEVPAILLF